MSDNLRPLLRRPLPKAPASVSASASESASVSESDSKSVSESVTADSVPGVTRRVIQDEIEREMAVYRGDLRQLSNVVRSLGDRLAEIGGDVSDLGQDIDLLRALYSDSNLSS